MCKVDLQAYALGGMRDCLDSRSRETSTTKAGLTNPVGKNNIQPFI